MQSAKCAFCDGAAAAAGAVGIGDSRSLIMTLQRCWQSIDCGDHDQYDDGHTKNDHRPCCSHLANTWFEEYIDMVVEVNLTMLLVLATM